MTIAHRVLGPRKPGMLPADGQGNSPSPAAQGGSSRWATPVPRPPCMMKARRPKADLLVRLQMLVMAGPS